MYTYDEVYKASLDYFKGNELATKVFVDKYALRDNGKFYEKTPDDMHRRIASEFHRIELKYPNPMSFDEIYGHLEGFKTIIPQGSPMFGIGNPFQVVSLSNCVVTTPPEDSLSNIYEVAKRMANLFARRCGVGTDLSRLRPEGSPVRNAAKTSTGAWSFAELYSFVCRHTAQEGRRGALMLTMSVDHPDIEKFVTMKQDLQAVTGANVSVLISRDFMNAVDADRDWDLKFNGKVYKTVRARDLWRLICTCAWKTAEPGVIFWDNYKENMPLNCYKDEGFEIVSTNPCGEIGLSPNDSCRLITINLKGFVKNPFTEKAYFDYDMFKNSVWAAQRMMDDLVDLEIEALRKIQDVSDCQDVKALFKQMEDSAIAGRRTGLGTTGLADCLAALGLKYDDPGAARKTIDQIYRTLRNEAYRCSINMARERGPFPIFNWEKEKDCAFFKTMPQDILDDMKTYGRRNGSILTNAPNGSTSIVAQLDGSGIEPFFALSFMRRRKINHNDPNARVDYIDESGDAWEHYTVHSHCVRQYLQVNNLPQDAPLPDYFITSAQIDKMERVDIQGLITSYIDHGTSSTINVPENTSVHEIEKIYERASRAGLKGVTVYREGCRAGVLVNKPKQEDDGWYKRPAVLPCDIHHVQVKEPDGQFKKFIILVGLRQGEAYEVFGGPAEDLNIPKSFTSGWISKHKDKKRNRYSLQLPGDGEIQDLGGLLVDGSYSTINRLCSFGLRNRGGVNFLVDQLTKEPGNDIYTYTKTLARVLKKYIADGQQSSSRCPECLEKSLVYKEGCIVCTVCGYSVCN